MIMKQTLDRPSRNNFIGGSDARTIVGKDEKALHRLWWARRRPSTSRTSQSFSEEGAAEKHMAQLQHNMLVAGTKKSVLSIINGGGKWIELSIEADPIYQTILIAAEKAFWRAVKTGEMPALFDCEPPKPRIAAVRVVDMNASNSWAEFAGLFCDTRQAHADHERAKSELKGLMAEDAKEARGWL
jgi:predicted phage-related endonuclease